MRAYLSTPSRLGKTSRKHLLPFRFLSVFLLAACLGIGLAAPAQACVHPPIEVGIWIIINGDNVWIILRGFVTFPPPPGVPVCGCGFRLLSSVPTMDTAQVVNSVTQAPVSSFQFATNGGIGPQLAAIQGGTWQGFASSVGPTIPDNLPVDLVFHGKLRSGAGFADVARDIRSIRSGAVVGTGKVNDAGQFMTPPEFPSRVGQIDQTNPSPGAPSLKVSRVSPGAPATVEVAVQDTEAGLSLVMVPIENNLSSEVASFVTGTKDPVPVVLNIGDEHALATAMIKSCNMLGRCAAANLSIMAMTLADRVTQQELPEIGGAQGRFYFQNGTPGVRMLALTTEGRRFSIRPLTSGQTLEGDLSLALHDGANVLTCAARGQVGARGLLVFYDSP